MGNFFSIITTFQEESLLRQIEHILLFLFIFAFLKSMSKGEGLRKNLVKSVVRLFTSNSLVKKQLQNVLNKEASKTVNTLMKGKATPKFKELPDAGYKHEEIINMMENRKQGDLNPYEGKSFAYVYQYSKEHNDLTGKAYNMFVHTNVLNPMKYVSLRNMEVEVVSMTASMFHGDENYVGNVSSGGSESILLAMKAYRDYYKNSHPGCDFKPQVIICETAHPAFVKAAQLFEMELVMVKADSDWKMDYNQIQPKINDKTCLIVASACQYPHGIVDPIEEVSEIGFKNNIPVHVDGAIGGFFLPWLEKLGQKIPPFDFRNRGVMSINADVHKFGFAPKGSSVIVFRKPEHRMNYFSTYAGWCGGLYVSPTLLGTRNGGPIAAAWASLMGIGKEGFMEINRKMLAAAQYLIKTVNDIPELQVIGDPQGILVSFTTTKESKMDIYHVADCLEERGYHMERQKDPNSIHCTLMLQHYIYREQLSKDLRECVQIVKENPKKYAGEDGSAAMYGMIGQIPDGAIVEDFLCNFLDRIYSF